MQKLIAIACVVLLANSISPGEPSARLPAGVSPVGNLPEPGANQLPGKRVCVNGLWQWQPADEGAEKVPEQGWGYFKVPGCWPGITDYMQKDSQTLYANPA